jgi:hypothetical protein
MLSRRNRSLPVAVCFICLISSCFAFSQDAKPSAAPQNKGVEQIVIPPGKESLPAEEVFKNIVILKGKPASALPGMMGALNGLLGVPCTHCHVQDAWDKEEPAAKLTSRKMFAMLRNTNTKFFDQANNITCWTCHRGSPTPVSGEKEIPAAMGQLPEDRKKLVNDLIAGLGDDKDKPAGTVFHNVKLFTAMPAQRMLRVMTVYTIVLGVDCSYCHTVGEWEKDNKPAKQAVARMQQMQASVNQELFDGQPKVACYTCHRGAAKPENLPKQ